MEALRDGNGLHESLMVMEYIKASPIDIKLYTLSDEALSGHVGKLLQHVGRMVICDILIDNQDRFMLPGINDIGSSNTGNALVTENMELCGIDHDVSADTRSLFTYLPILSSFSTN